MSNGSTSTTTSTSPTSSADNSSGSCSCSTSSATPNSGAPTIVIDPGHSGTKNQVIDPTTGLIDFDYPNVPEINEVFDIAQDLKTKLTAAGYNVVLTKQNVNDTVSLRQRADIANQSKAALAVSIHDDHSQPYGSFQQIYDQQVGAYRTNPQGQNTTFTNVDVATKSAQYSAIFQQTRQADQGIQPTIKLNSFDGRSGLSPGNIPLVQLFANVPWVYNEAGASDITPADLQSYSKGILDGIEKSIPLTGAPASAASSSSSTGCSSVASTCTPPDVTTSSSTPDISQVRKNVVCIAQHELAIWSSQPGYPWKGDNDYAASGYLQYSEGRHEEWCADFASWVYNQANYPLAAGGKWDIPGVTGIQAIGEKNAGFTWHSSSGYTPLPGDLAIHDGSHVNIVISVSGRMVTLIGGDEAHGGYPGGSIVAKDVLSSPTDNGITGYVSPNQ
jgi:N-acetylmuramoyl-L-alanine amidase